MISATSGQEAQSCWYAPGVHPVARSIWRSTVAAARLLKRDPFAGGIWDRLRLVRGAAGFGPIENGRLH